MSRDRGTEAAGYLCVIAAALLWATSGVLGKSLFAGGMTPGELVQVRVALSTLAAGVALAVRDARLFRVRRRDLAYFVVLGAGLALVQVTYFLAISRIQVAAAILLQYLSPVLVTGFSVAFWGERPTAAKLGALGLASAGCYLVVGGYDLRLLEMNRVGIAAGLASAAAFAGYTLLGERGMRRYSAWTILFYALLFATVTMHLLFEPFQYLGGGYSVGRWVRVLYVAVAGTVIPFGLYFAGVDRIRSTRASIAATLEPVAAGFIAFLALGETLAPVRVLGGAFVIAGVLLLRGERDHSSLAPSEIRAQREQGGG